MNSIAYTVMTSGGGWPLDEALRIANFDYQRHFGREPRKIVVPYFRRDEIDERLLTGWNTKEGPLFLGIPFRFSIVSDAIELFGEDLC